MGTGVLIAMGVCRVLIGLTPFFMAGPAVRLLRVPGSHDNPSMRLMARLFGVRDVGLGVLVFWATSHPEALGFVLLFNAVTDFGDAASAAIPLLKRDGIDLAAGFTLALASAAGVLWLVVHAWLV